MTNDNYPIAMHILQDKFGKKEAIIEALYSQLQHLSIMTNQLTKNKSTYETVERILRQLETQVKEFISREFLHYRFYQSSQQIISLSNLKDQRIYRINGQQNYYEFLSSSISLFIPMLNDMT